MVAKVEFHVGELFPRLGFVVTKTQLANRKVVHFCNQRGKAEQWIKEGKQAVTMTRLLAIASWPREEIQHELKLVIRKMHLRIERHRNQPDSIAHHKFLRGCIHLPQLTQPRRQTPPMSRPNGSCEPRMRQGIHKSRHPQMIIPLKTVTLPPRESRLGVFLVRLEPG